MRRIGVIALALSACASPAERVDSVRSAIIGGEDSDASENAVVLVMHYDVLRTGGGTGGCTGVMLAPNLVLTARHCVSVTELSAACNEEGTADFGGGVEADHKASALYVFAGQARPDFLSGLPNAARGAEILTNGSQTICNDDIALLVLERPLEGADIAPVRLDGAPKTGERVKVVGWGVTKDEPQPETRQRRTNVAVEQVGPAFRLGPAEFRLGESACSGDSGGPALSQGGAVVGVLSRGGNGEGADPGTADACIGGENVFVSTAGHRDFLLGGYDKVGQRPWLEGERDPRLPEVEEEDDDTGCSAAPRRAPDAAWLLGLALVAAARRRRS